MAGEDIREIVQTRYGQAVKAAVGGGKTSCCGSKSSCGPETSDILARVDPITRDLYSAEDAAAVPHSSRMLNPRLLSLNMC